MYYVGGHALFTACSTAVHVRGAANKQRTNMNTSANSTHRGAGSVNKQTNTGFQPMFVHVLFICSRTNK